jgi:hypothetical protein
MHRERLPGRAPGRQSPTESGSVQQQLAPGKRTLTEDLLAERREAAVTPGAGTGMDARSGPSDAGSHRPDPAAGEADAQVRAAAARGTAMPASRLPYADRIQRAFGRHDVSGIQAHVGPDAAASARAMGAQAYATGDHVVLGPDADLHTVAHEAAHVIQQRAGVQLKGGVGEVGDAYERHADEVADLVVRGSSAQAALDRLAPGEGARGAPREAVQRSPVTTNHGTFEDVYFSEVKEAGIAVGVEVFLRFTPNAKVDATKIGLSQSVKTQVGGHAVPIDATKRSQQVKTGPNKGYVIDRESDRRNPLYAAGSDRETNEDTLGAYSTPSPVRPLLPDERRPGVTGEGYAGWGQHGHRKHEASGWTASPAELHDSPTLNTRQAGASTLFETTAIAIEGAQKDTYYGSVSWGMQTDAEGKLSKVELAKASDAVPTQNFMAAAKQWNTSTARGTLVTTAEQTQVYQADEEGLSESFTLPAGVSLVQRDTVMGDGTVYLAVEIDASAPAHPGKTGYVEASDVEDIGNGLPTVPLPYVQVKHTTTSTALYRASDKQELLVELARGTRLTLLRDEGGMQEVAVADGAHAGSTGWIAAGLIENEA